MTGAAVSPVGRLAGAYLKNVQVLPIYPAWGGVNTAPTMTYTAKLLDPWKRSGAVAFAMDRLATWGTAYLQTSGNVTGPGWADTPLSWVSATASNGSYVWRARSTNVHIGWGPNLSAGRYAPAAIPFRQDGGTGLARALYLIESLGIQTRVAGAGSNARGLYLGYNAAVRNYLDKPFARTLYLGENRSMYPGVLVAGNRTLYLYEATRDGEVFPWLSHLSPAEQYAGGQVDLYGDGLGEWLEAAAGATITVDSVNAGYVAANAVDRAAGSWVSNATRANAWIRFTFGSSKRIVAIALEAAGNGWGVPRFLFSSGAEVSGGGSVPGGVNVDAQYPCGTTRQRYTLPTPRDTTYVEIRGPAGDSTTFVGLYEVWIIEQAVPADGAEASRAWLNLDLPTEQDMGIVAWQNRSPNLYPANSGVPLLAAATVTIPSGAVSGLVTVQEEI